MISQLKARINKLKSQQNEVNVKITIHAERDWLAAEAYLQLYYRLETQLVELTKILEELELQSKPIQYEWDLSTDQTVS